MLAVKEQQSAGSQTSNYASMCAFNLRSRLPAPHNGPIFACNGAHTGLPIAFKPSGSFNDDVGKVGEFYRKALSGNVVEGLKVYHEKLTHQFSQLPAEGSMLPAETALNSIGVVDKYIKRRYGEMPLRVDVKNFWLGNTICTPTVWVHLWTFQDQITLSALHNEGFYPSPTTVRSLLQKVKGILCHNLGLRAEEI